MARAKGLPEWVVLGKYALRNALLPLITIIGLSFPELFTGSIIIEGVCSYAGVPVGIGRTKWLWSCHVSSFGTTAVTFY